MSKFKIGDLVFVRRPDNQPDRERPISSDGIPWLEDMDKYENSIYRVSYVWKNSSYYDLETVGGLTTIDCSIIDDHIFSEEWLEPYNEDDFFIGGKYVVRKPKTPDGIEATPSWVPEMDKYDGTVVTITSLEDYLALVEGTWYTFNIGWLIPFNDEDEVNLPYFDSIDVSSLL